DRFFGRSVVFADCHVERWRRVISALRTLDIVGGRLDCFLDAIARRLVVVFAGLAPVRQRQHRDWNAVSPRQESCETCRRLAVRTLINCEQQTFEIRTKAPSLKLLAL